MKRSARKGRAILYLLIFLLFFALCSWDPPFRSAITRILMLFTAHSKEAVIGYLNQAGALSPLYALGFMIIQAVIIPFDPEIFVLVNVRVFGTAEGVLLSIMGRLLGVWLCYDLGRVFLSDLVDQVMTRIKKTQQMNSLRKSTLVNILLRVVPLEFDLVSYLGGAFRFDRSRFFWNSLFWTAFMVTILAVNGNYLSSKAETFLFITRSIAAVVLTGIFLKNRNPSSLPT